MGPSSTLPCQLPCCQQIVDCHSVPETIFCGYFSFCTSHCSGSVWRSLYRDCGKGLTIRGSNIDRGKRFFCYPKRPHRFLGPVCLIFGGSLGSFPDVNLTSRPHLVSRLRISGSIPLLPLHACATWTGRLASYLFASPHSSGKQTKFAFPTVVVHGRATVLWCVVAKS